MRYFRLYLYFLRFSFSKAMEFRFDFFFKFAMDCIYYAVNWFFYWALFHHTESLAGWKSDQIMVFVAATFVVDAIMMTVFMPNLWHLPMAINKGDLDYYLVRPINTLFFVTLREFAANSFLNLLVAVGILVYAVQQLQQSVSLGSVILFFALVMNGAFLIYLIQLLHTIPVFWTQAPQGYHDVFWTLNGFSEKPHKIFGLTMQRILIFVLPFALVTSVPTSLLLDGFQWPLAWTVAGVTAALFAFVVFVWKAGLRVYSSASS